MILSSYDDIKNMNHIELKRHSKNKEVLRNIDSSCRFNIFRNYTNARVTNTANVISKESKAYKNMFDNDKISSSF